MSALTERLIAARDRIKPLTRYGEDAVRRPAQNAHEVMADAANVLTDMAEALKGAIGALEFSRDYHRDLGNEDQALCQDRLDAATAALAKAGAR